MPVMLLGSPARRDELWRRLVTPNEDTPFRALCLIGGAWLFAVFVGWNAVKPDIFPSLMDVLRAFPALWVDGGLGQELISSLTVNWEALFLSAAIALPLAYLSRVALTKPVAFGISKLRFVSPAIFYVPFLFFASTGHMLKVYMLTMGETVFLVTTMIGVVAAIPEYKFDDARTLRMSEWKGLWYVAVRGTVPDALVAIRDNHAMGWSMLMMVEGMVRSEGGVGVMILNQERHVNFAEIYAIAIAIVVVGIAADAMISLFKQMVCPYAD